MGKFRYISKTELKYIYNNMFITNHAKQRMKERGAKISDFLESDIHYQGLDKSYNIAVNDYEYFVVEHNVNYNKGKKQKRYTLVTFNARGRDNITIQDKIAMEKEGKRGKHVPRYKG